MKTSRLLTFGVFTSMLLSSISLGYQLKTNKYASKFDKYRTPVQITYLDQKFALANMAMVRNLMPTQDGISIPEVWGLSDDDSHVIVRVFISEKDLPSSFDRRKKAFEDTATAAAAMVTAQFNAEYN